MRQLLRRPLGGPGPGGVSNRSLEVTGLAGGQWSGNGIDPIREEEGWSSAANRVHARLERLYRCQRCGLLVRDARYGRTVAAPARWTDLDRNVRHHAHDVGSK